MKRRDFLSTAAASTLVPGVLASSGCNSETASTESNGGGTNMGPGYATPADAIKSPRETMLYTVGIYTGTDIDEPDYFATVDVDPESETYSQVVNRLPMTHKGDELHHFGWNACSSCHGKADKERRFAVLTGLVSSRIYIIDLADRNNPKLYKTIEPEEIKEKTNLSSPHTTHCLASGEVMFSMLGDAKGDGPGGFLLLDEDFNIKGRWEDEDGSKEMTYNYDFWYQPRHNLMVSSEWATPNTFQSGFDPKDVEAGKYGKRLIFWDWNERKIVDTHDLGENGLIPLEVRFHHDPDSTHGFVGAALSSAVWHWHKPEGQDKWGKEKILQVEPSGELPALITDILISMNDKYLYLSNWLKGEIHQYDITDPSKPRLAGNIKCGGVGVDGPTVKGKKLTGGPQMLQLSLDGKRLYATNSLLSKWDNQFYPEIAKEGSYMIMIDCDSEKGGMTLNEDFMVDFGKEPLGPARAHEMRFPGGDCSSDIWV